MDTRVASQIIATAETLPKTLRVVDAEALIRAWLRASGNAEDRYGNFALKPSDDGRPRRYHFTDRQLQKQYKTPSGDWYNVLSTPMLDAANQLLKLAAETLGRTDILERATKAKERRTTETEKRASKAEEKRVDEQAVSWAKKYVAKRYRDDVLKNFTDQKIDPDRIAEIKQVFEFNKTFFLAAARGQRTKPTDDLFASVDLPPIVPLFAEEAYQWDETEGGVPYTIRVSHREKNKAVIHIGTSGGMVSVDPTNMRLIPSDESSVKGDGWIDGYVLWYEGKFHAALVLISAKQGKRRAGAGSRLLNLWCRLMAGYGVENWVAVAVGDEGAAFLEALERRGRIKIGARSGSNWAVRCT